MDSEVIRFLSLFGIDPQQNHFRYERVYFATGFAVILIGLISILAYLFMNYAYIIGFFLTIITVLYGFNLLALRTMKMAANDKIDKFKCSPEIFISLIKNKQKYCVKDYEFTTKDGYILTIFRINLQPSYKLQIKEKGCIDKPMLLLHSFINSSDQFFIVNDNKRLGYYLVDKGYDVWLFNQRGNKYSLDHTDKQITQEKYFGYTCDDVACYDIPACYENIMDITRKNRLVLCGYSMGGFYSLLS